MSDVEAARAYSRCPVIGPLWRLGGNESITIDWLATGHCRLCALGVVAPHAVSGMATSCPVDRGVFIGANVVACVDVATYDAVCRFCKHAGAPLGDARCHYWLAHYCHSS